VSVREDTLIECEDLANSLRTRKDLVPIKNDEEMKAGLGWRRTTEVFTLSLRQRKGSAPMVSKGARHG
jgi:hypothetical protein